MKRSKMVLQGASLGMELAGEVVRVGSAVDDFKVGQAVIGFAPACFSSSVITVKPLPLRLNRLNGVMKRQPRFPPLSLPCITPCSIWHN